MLLSDDHRLRVLIQNSIRWGIGGDRYTFDNREMLMSGDGLRLAATSLSDLLDQAPCDALVCSGVGGVPLATALKLQLPDRMKLNVVRTERKGRDENKLVEGPRLSPGDRVWIVDDLLNTGTTFDQIVAALDEEYTGLVIEGILVLVDFDEWGSRRLVSLGYDVRAIYTVDELNLVPPKTTTGHVTLRWQNLDVSANPHDFFHSCPTIAGDKLVVGTDRSEWVCCNKFTGDILWTLASRRPAVKPVASRPVIIGNRVVVAAYDGVVRLLDLNNGDVIWQNKLDSFIHSTPQVHDDLLFVGTEGRLRADHYGDIVCLDHATGREHWRVKTADMVPCTPLVLPDYHRIICASNDTFLYAVGFDGEVKWKVKTDRHVKGKLAFQDGLIYAATCQGFLECRDIDGDLVWSRKLGTSLHHGFPVLHGVHVIVALQESAIAALNRFTGDVIWYNRQHAVPAYEIAPHGNEGFCVTRRGDLSKIDLRSGRTLWSERVSTYGHVHQPVVFDPPFVYMITNIGGLAAFEVIDESYS